MAQFHIYKN